MRKYTSNQYSYVRGPLRECRSIRPVASGLPYYCAPLVRVSAVMDGLAVWRHNKPKTKNQTRLRSESKNDNKSHPAIFCHFCGNFCVSRGTLQKLQRRRRYEKRIHLNYYCGCVFCSILRLCILVFAYFFTSKVHCGSAVRFDQALPGFLITAHHLYASLL